MELSNIINVASAMQNGNLAYHMRKWSIWRLPAYQQDSISCTIAHRKYGRIEGRRLGILAYCTPWAIESKSSVCDAIVKLHVSEFKLTLDSEWHLHAKLG